MIFLGKEIKKEKTEKLKKEITKKLQDLSEIFLDVLFPKFCLGCGKEGSYICSDCEIFLSENTPICPICFKHSKTGKKHQICGKKYDIDGVVSVWDYEGIFRKAIIEIKTDNYFDITKELIRKSFKEILRDEKKFSDFLLFFCEDPKITFIPQFSEKNQIEDDKNHAKLIASQFALFLEKEHLFLSLLKKTKKTEKQAYLSKEKRLKNLKDSFDIKKDISIPEKVILIDDVFTTGATIKEATKTLKMAGVKKVWGFCLARTVK